MSTRTRVRGRDFEVRTFPSGATSVAGVGGDDEATVYVVKANGDGRVMVEVAGRRYQAEAVRVGGDCWVHVNGRAYLVQVSDASGQRARTRAHVHDILAAPMPATVVRLDVAVGDEVGEGQVLLVLEAMKMQMPLKAPHRAVVRTIGCAVGDLVQPQVALIELDEIGG
jgi:acetyl/propionyl-CoA carboxylase alpha subunit